MHANHDEESRSKRLPDLGRLSIAILEDYAEKVIGQEALNEIRAPLVEKELRETLAKTLETSEKRFLHEHEDSELCEAILNLPIADLPSFQNSVRDFYDRPADPAIQIMLRKRLEEDFPNIPSNRFDAAVDAYVQILRQEMISASEEMRSKLQALSALEMQHDIERIAAGVEEMVELTKISQTYPPGSAPPTPQLIIGRAEDIEKLKKRLGFEGEKPRTTQVLTAIRGWPGVGKTTIASALAYEPEVSTAFPDGILWASLGQEPNVLSEMAAWGRALGTDELVKARTIQEAQAQLAALLRNKRMLLLIDDVWKAEHAIPFNVGGQGCATLVTTRLNNVARALAPMPDSIYLLSVLSDQHAMELLKELAPLVVEKHTDECLVLVHELEGLPLALQVAGRLLQAEASMGFEVNELIKDLQAGAKLLEAEAPLDRTDLAKETTPTIAALLQKSTDLLDDFTRDCYAYLGAFAPKPATFDLEAMKFVWQVDDAKPIARILVDRGLLEFVPKLERYQMHALLVMQARSLLTDE
jgi:hypothetical protein